MGPLKLPAFVATMAAIACILSGVSSASATELYKGPPSEEVTVGLGSEVALSIANGQSVLMEKTAGGVLEICSTSVFEGTIEEAGGESPHPRAKLSNFSLESCEHPTTTINAGSISIEHIPGTTDGTVVSEELEASMFITAFGIKCTAKTGPGTHLGVLTGAESSTGYATLDMYAVVNLGFCPHIRLTGTYTVTNPTGLVVEAE